MGVLKECWCAEGVLAQEKSPEEDSSARLEHSSVQGSRVFLRALNILKRP
jgi:hypothetical protein